MLIFLILVMVLWVFARVQTHQIVHIKYMQFFVYLILKNLSPSPSFLSLRIWKVQSSQENLPTSHDLELYSMIMPSCKGGLQ